MKPERKISTMLIKKLKYWLFHKKWQSSSKYCPRCGNTALGEMATLQLKVCQQCVPNTWIKWPLNKNQKPRI
jgi:hypothetical protein